jgi:hypothetical protein
MRNALYEANFRARAHSRRVPFFSYSRADSTSARRAVRAPRPLRSALR